MIISRVEAERMLETQAGAYEAMANAWEQLKPAIIAEAGRRVDANAAKRINAAVPQLQINIEHEAIYNGKKTNIKAAFPYHDDVFKYLAGYNYTTDGDGNKRRFPKYSYVPNAGGYVVNHSIIRAAGDPFPVFSAELIDAICSVSESGRNITAIAPRNFPPRSSILTAALTHTTPRLKRLRMLATRSL